MNITFTRKLGTFKINFSRCFVERILKVMHKNRVEMYRVNLILSYTANNCAYMIHDNPKFTM